MELCRTVCRNRPNMEHKLQHQATGNSIVSHNLEAHWGAKYGFSTSPVLPPLIKITVFVSGPEKIPQSRFLERAM